MEEILKIVNYSSLTLIQKYSSKLIKHPQEELKRDLEEVFGVFGKIRETTVKTKQGSSNTFVFIEF